MLAVDPSAAGLSWHRTLEERGDLEEVERKVSPSSGPTSGSIRSIGVTSGTAGPVLAGPLFGP